jgi:hypothetical protein
MKTFKFRAHAILRLYANALEVEGWGRSKVSERLVAQRVFATEQMD